MIARALIDDELAAAEALAEEWAARAPEWFRASRAVDVEGNQPVVGIGVYEAGKLVGLVRLSAIASEIYEVHFDADRSADGDALAIVILAAVKELMAGGAQAVICWTLRQNRRVTQIAEACGGRWDGTTRLKGVHRGRYFEWRRFILLRG